MIYTRASYVVEPQRGAVFLFSISHGAVRCGFYFFRIVRCGAVRFSLSQNHTVRCGVDYIFKESYGAMRCGHPMNSFFLWCG